MDNIIRINSSAYLQKISISIAGGLILLLGLMVMAGWYSHAEALVQIIPSYTPMQYNAALGFLLCGIGLLANLYDQPRIALISGVLVLTIGLLISAEYLFDINLGIDQFFIEHYITTKSVYPGRMAPATAITFILSGAALLCLRFLSCPVTTGLLGSVIAAIGLGTLFGYMLGTETPYGWSHASYMAINTAAGFTLLGSGILLLIYHKATKTSSQPQKWLAFAFGIGVATIAISLWQGLLTQERNHINETITTQTTTLKIGIEKLIEKQVQGLIQLGNRWEFNGGTPQDEWQDDTALYIEHQPGYQAIEWVDPSYHVRWIQPLDGNEQAQNLDIMFEGRRQEAMIKAREERKVQLSRSIDLVQGGKGFLVYKPLFLDNRFDGFMVGVFRLHKLLDILSQQENFSQKYVISVFDDDELIYESQEASPLYDTERGHEIDIKLYNVTWHLRAYPTRELIATMQSSLPVIALSVGLMIALLLALIINRSQTIRENVKTIKQANKKLEDEITDRIKIDNSLHEYKEHLEELVDERTSVLQETNIRLLQEINERRSTKKALRIRETYIRTLADLAPVGIFRADMSGKCTYINETYSKFSGLTQQEALGDGWLKVIHPEDSECLKDKWEYSVTNNKPFIAEKRYLHADGTIKWGLCNAVAEKDDNGEIIGYLGAVTDITDRKHDQELLTQSEKQLRDLAGHLESIREEERKIIARDIHDELGQILTALSTDIHWIISNCPENQYILEEKALSMLPNIEGAIQSVQRIVSELRPAILDDLGIEPAMTWYCEQFQNRTGITCKPEINLDDSSLSPECSTAIFRILQESLTNIVRHSGASSVIVTLDANKDTIDMEIADNGKGITNDEMNASNSFGLIGMRERALTFGGNIAIKKRNGHGTSVSLILPNCCLINTNTPPTHERTLS